VEASEKQRAAAGDTASASAAGEARLAERLAAFGLPTY
jgi:hypothetical protein